MNNTNISENKKLINSNTAKIKFIESDIKKTYESDNRNLQNETDDPNNRFNERLDNMKTLTTAVRSNRTNVTKLLANYDRLKTHLYVQHNS